MKSRNAVYDLEEAAALTERSREELQQAIAAGDLAVAETGAEGEVYISGIELERWYQGLEEGKGELFAEDREGP